MRTAVLNTCRKIFFKNRPGEKIIASLIGKYPHLNFLEKLPPNPYQYKKSSLRKATRNGITYLLDLSDYQEWLVFFNVKTDSSLPLLQFLDKDNVFFDVGGNIGQTALNASKVVGKNGKVYSFEPFPESYAKFTQNLELNPFIKNVFLSVFGLGAKVSTQYMEVSLAENSGGNRISSTDESGVKIETTTLDSFVDENEIKIIHFIKIDVEGFEMEVLKGAQSMLRNFHPKLYIEINSSNLQRYGSSLEEIFQFIESFGYSIKHMQDQIILTNLNIGEYNDAHFDIICTPVNL